MSSSRLPGKVMRPLLGEPMIGRQIERILRAQKLDRLIVATSGRSDDDVVSRHCRALGVGVHRGSLDDALDRYVGATREFGRQAKHIVRLTADCPLTDWSVIDACVDQHLHAGDAFTSNAMRRTFPQGLDVEVMTVSLLEELAAHSTTVQREHVTQLVYDQPQTYRIGHVTQAIDESQRRWTVDTAADFAMVEAVYGALYVQKPDFKSQDIRDFLDSRPEIRRINGA